MTLAQFIDQHEGVINAYIRSLAPSCPIDEQERFAWCHIDEDLYYVAREAGVTDLPDLGFDVMGEPFQSDPYDVPPGGIWSAPQPQSSGRL